MSEAPPLAAVLGAPIGHSKSPILHGHWLRTMGIRGHYIPIELGDQTFEEGIRGLQTLGFRGANVTLPFKERAFAIADTHTDRALRIGAANTLTFTDGRIHADNTDSYGFLNNLQQHVPDWSAETGPALVVGAGGASRAIIVGLIDAGAPEVLLANRTRTRAEQLADEFGPKISVIDWSDLTPALDGVATLVNTTSIGMGGAGELPIDLAAADKTTVVTDIVYTPLNTPLLHAASTVGLRTVDGLGMLLHQAVPGFEAWFGQTPVVDEALRQAILTA
ncbi:MAG: shikimate dehydrogenase [Pseudomonadota bacterium]